MSQRRAFLVHLTALAAGALVAGGAEPAPAAAATPAGSDNVAEVAVTIPPLAGFVRRVGGDRVSVATMAGPGTDPHTYEPSPRQMVALARARLYFRTGLPFEEAWLPRLAAANPGLRIVDLREGLELREAEEHDHDEHGHGHGEEGADPHVWTSPVLVRRMAERIRGELAALVPEHAAVFAANHARFDADLVALDGEVRRLLEGLQGRRFLVYHPAWGYFADAYGLEQVAIEAGGKEPGPRTMADLVAQAQAAGIRVVFVQEQFSEAQARAVAEAIGGEVVTLDPLAEDFFGSTRAAAAALSRALR